MKNKTPNKEQLIRDWIAKLIKEQESTKCKYCGMTDGIHRSDCYFLHKFEQT